MTRAELCSLKDSIVLTPVFEGRAEARDAIQEYFASPVPGRSTKVPFQLPPEKSARALGLQSASVDDPTDLISRDIQNRIRAVGGCRAF